MHGAVSDIKHEEQHGRTRSFVYVFTSRMLCQQRTEIVVRRKFFVWLG